MMREGGRRGWTSAGMESWEMGATRPSCPRAGMGTRGLLGTARFGMSIRWWPPSNDRGEVMGSEEGREMGPCRVMGLPGAGGWLQP